jgi:diguanylate cyclase (GGDEF)-like protein
LNNETLNKAEAPKDDSSSRNSLAIWLRLQRSLAERSDISLSTLNRDCAVIGRIENDNSICQAMRASPEHARLCAADCANAYEGAVGVGETMEFRCHAGLHCFAIPVAINDKRLVILGGRVFTSASEYTEFLNTYGELEEIRSGEGLKNLKFVDSRELREAGDLVASTAQYHFERSPAVESRTRTEPETAPELLDAHLEIIRLADQLESQNRSMAQFFDFLRGVASNLDSQKVYQSALVKFSAIMSAERSSLMIVNDQADELTLEAATGANSETLGPVRVKLGEGIAGGVLASGKALVVRNVETDSRVSAVRRGGYKGRSFISYPITLGHRKVGVINLTDRADGSTYESEDLSLLEMMAPHLALIIDRTEWHRKAEAYQRMSLTDALTGLPNRRYLEERLFEEVERSKRHGTPLSFAIIDIDHFKSYNDIYGHTNADRVLIKTANLLRASVRAIDMATRFAGDEFCVVLPETGIFDAAQIAERLRREVSQAEYRSEQDELMGRVSISVGVSSFSPSRQSSHAIIESADRALYQAKTCGRNCVAIYDDPVSGR